MPSPESVPVRFELGRFLAEAWADSAPIHDLGGSAFRAAPWAERGLPPVSSEAADALLMEMHARTELQADLAGYLGATRNDVLVTAGTTSANSAVLLQCARGRVLCERPYYEPLPKLAEALGADVSYVDRDEGRLDPAAVEDALADDVQLVVLTSPNNPTGHAADAADLQRIGDAAAAHGATVLVDQVFRELTDAPIARHDAIISTGGFNKRWGAQGLRIGWAVGPNVAERFIDASSLLQLAPPWFGTHAARVLLAHASLCRQQLEARLGETHPVWEKHAAEMGWPTAAPGALTVFPEVPLPDDEMAWARRCRRAGLLALPGGLFGAPGHVRVGLGGDAAALDAALTALRAHLGAG